MEIVSSLYLIEVNYYSESALLNLLKDANIRVYNFTLKKEYLFSFKIEAKQYKILKRVLKEFKIVKKEGFLPFLKKQLFHRVTILASILSLILFSFCTTLLLKINIEGTNKQINENISLYLEQKNIKKFSFKPSLKHLKELKDEFFLNNLNSLETIEFIMEGNVLFVHYSLKKKTIEIEKKHGKMFAKKDAIIDKIEISSGNVLVKEYQFVKRGELIVDDYLYYKDNPIYVGTRGKIYGYTYESVLVSVYYEGNKDDCFIYLLDEARREVSSSFQDNEHIEKEVINDFYNKNNYIFLNISYKLYENIVEF